MKHNVHKQTVGLLLVARDKDEALRLARELPGFRPRDFQVNMIGENQAFVGGVATAQIPVQHPVIRIVAAASEYADCPQCEQLNTPS